MSQTHLPFDLCLDKQDRGRFSAYVAEEAAGSTGGFPLPRTFTLHTGTLKQRDDLRYLGEVMRGQIPAGSDFLKNFGKMLYRKVLAGPVGERMDRLLAKARSQGLGLHMRIRIHPGARELCRLPWELLHDGQGFLATRWETPITRLPLDVLPRLADPLHTRPRVLLFTSAPRDLVGDHKPHARREVGLLVESLDRLQARASLRLDVAEGDTLDALQDSIYFNKYEILHIVCRCDATPDGQSRLVLCDEVGNGAPTGAEVIASMLRGAPSVRLVVLSAFQSARRPHNPGFGHMARVLVREGVPAVLCLENRLPEESAGPFFQRLYGSLCRGSALPLALTEARQEMHASALGSPRGLFGSTVMLVNDPDALQVTQPMSSPRPADPRVPAIEDLGALPVLDEGLVGRLGEVRRIITALRGGRARAVVIHGLAGVGKSVLATRVARLLAPEMTVVKAVSMHPRMTADEVVRALCEALVLAGVQDAARVLSPGVSADARAGALANLLARTPALLILDSMEQVVTPVDPEPRDAGLGPPVRLADPELSRLLDRLVTAADRNVRFIFTSRVDLDPVPGWSSGEVLHFSLGELSFAAAVQCMAAHESLARLPALSPGKMARLLDATAATSADADTAERRPVGTSKEAIYDRVGGHPLAIARFAARAAVSSAAQALAAIDELEQELFAQAGLDHAYAALPFDAQTLLQRASVFDDAPPLEALLWMSGDEENFLSSIDVDLRALLAWGFFARTEVVGGEILMRPMTLARRFARTRRGHSPEVERGLLGRAARFWEHQGRKRKGLSEWLSAREFHFRAGDYQAAFSIVEAAVDPMMRWGLTDRLLELLAESVATVQGEDKARALQLLARVHAELGDVSQALSCYRMAERGIRALGRDDPALLAQLPRIHLRRAELHLRESHVKRAKSALERALVQSEELGFGAQSARVLSELARVHRRMDDPERALEYLQRALSAHEQHGKPADITITHREIGELHLDSGNARWALEALGRALGLAREQKDAEQVARCQVALGRAYLELARVDDAATMLDRALIRAGELGIDELKWSALLPLADVDLHQSRPRKARERLETALGLAVDARNDAAIARVLRRLAPLHQEAVQDDRALEHWVHLLGVEERLGEEKREVRHALSVLRKRMGAEAFSDTLAGLGYVAWTSGGADAAPDDRITRIGKLVVRNTVAVLTDLPSKRAEWNSRLGRMREQAQHHGETHLAALLGATQLVMAGANPETVTAPAEEPYNTFWTEIVKGLSSWAPPERTPSNRGTLPRVGR